MELLKLVAVTVAAVVGLPLLIVGVTLLGPVGLIAAAVLVPLVAVGAIVVVVRRARRVDEHDS